MAKIGDGVLNYEKAGETISLTYVLTGVLDAAILIGHTSKTFSNKRITSFSTPQH